MVSINNGQTIDILVFLIGTLVRFSFTSQTLHRISPRGSYSLKTHCYQRYYQSAQSGENKDPE